MIADDILDILEIKEITPAKRDQLNELILKIRTQNYKKGQEDLRSRQQYTDHEWEDENE